MPRASIGSVQTPLDYAHWYIQTNRFGSVVLPKSPPGRKDLCGERMNPQLYLFCSFKCNLSSLEDDLDLTVHDENKCLKREYPLIVIKMSPASCM